MVPNKDAFMERFDSATSILTDVSFVTNSSTLSEAGSENGNPSKPHKSTTSEKHPVNNLEDASSSMDEEESIENNLNETEIMKRIESSVALAKELEEKRMRNITFFEKSIGQGKYNHPMIVHEDDKYFLLDGEFLKGLERKQAQKELQMRREKMKSLCEWPEWWKTDPLRKREYFPTRITSSFSSISPLKKRPNRHDDRSGVSSTMRSLQSNSSFNFQGSIDYSPLNSSRSRSASPMKKSRLQKATSEIYQLNSSIRSVASPSKLARPQTSMNSRSTSPSKRKLVQSKPKSKKIKSQMNNDKSLRNSVTQTIKEWNTTVTLDIDLETIDDLDDLDDLNDLDI